MFFKYLLLIAISSKCFMKNASHQIFAIYVNSLDRSNEATRTTLKNCEFIDT